MWLDLYTIYIGKDKVHCKIGDECRSRQSQLPADTSSTTYRDDGYVPSIQDWITSNLFITPGHHRHVKILTILKKFESFLLG